MRVLYRNEGSTTVNHAEGGVFIPGQSKTLRKFLIDPLGLTLVAFDAQAPWDTKHADTISALTNPIVDLQNYKAIHITNKSGDVLEVIANGDSTNVLYILDGATWPIQQEEVTEKTIYSIDLAGSGEGKVYIIGMRRDG